LRTFVAVVDCGGFTRAAELLNRTQSAVSMQIKRLEGTVKADLFVRSHRMLQLTAEGDRLLDFARRIVALNDEAVETILDRRAQGVIRLGVMDDYATEILPPLLKRFIAQNPMVYIDVHTGLTAHMPALLGKQLDLVLAMHAAGSGNGRFVRQENAVWAAAPSFVLDPDGEIPLALYPRDCVFRDWAVASLENAGKRWRVAYNSSNISAIRAAVSAGIAVGVFKASTVPKELVILGPELGFPSLPAADIVLYRAPGKLSPIVERLAAFLEESLKGERGRANAA
jgi:DNA-binding transcriptional LysR family regulator